MLETVFVPNSGSTNIGWFCIRDGWAMQDKPVRIIQYWPLEEGSRDRFEGLIGITNIIYNRIAYSYSIRTGDHKWETFRLPDGGRTTSLKVEEEDIPPPKTRVETRYYFGHWERYLKNKGWVR